jgi:hypothetical protein
MQKTALSFVLIAVLLFVFSSCRRNVAQKSDSPGTSTSGQSVASAPCIIYKTKADYSHNVPVILNDKRTGISSYPGRKDIYIKDELAYPTLLADGFLLDNRGIGPNVAFLDYTYEEYSKLEKTPSVDELMKHILDQDPLTVMYQCGNRHNYQDIENDMNKMIREGNLGSCKKLK